MIKQANDLFSELDAGEWAGRQFLMFDLDEMADQAEATSNDVIRMTLGKSELPPHKSVVNAMLEAAADFSRSALVYPAGLPQLRARIAEGYQRSHGIDINPRQVIINTGTSGLFRNLFYLLAKPGGEILLPRPYYPLYVFCAQLAGLRIKYYDIDTATMKIDLDSVADALSKDTVAIVVNSPGNPLGNVISLEELKAIDMLVAGRGVIVSDEIYSNVYFDENPFSIAQLHEPMCPIVITNGFSKAHRMYARRVGYAIVPQFLGGPLTVIQQHTLLTTDPVPQFGALAALELQSDVQELVKLYRSRRDRALERFADVDEVDALPSRGGFYMTLDWTSFVGRFKSENSHQLARQIFERTHVATVPGSDFGLDTALRMSFTCSKFNEGIDRIVEFFRTYER